MRHIVDYDAAGRYLVVETSGKASVAGFVAFTESIRAHPMWAPGRPVLIDHTLLVVDDFSTDETRLVVQEAFAVSARLGQFKAAIVMTTALAFGLGRLWQQHIGPVDDTADTSLAIFHTRGEADAWLRGQAPAD